MRRALTIVLLVLFTIGGIWGHFSKSFIEKYHGSVYNWLIIPAVIIGIFSAFVLTRKHSKNAADIAVKRIVFTVIAFAISLRIMQGYAILFNCHTGRQVEVYIQGEIIDVHHPAWKRIFEKNEITIFNDSDNERLSLEVPGPHYSKGEIFQKKMMIGSLGILYATK
jgi:hypothetical protein